MTQGAIRGSQTSPLLAGATPRQLSWEGSPGEQSGMLVYHRAVRAQNLGGPLDSPLLPALLQQRFSQPQPQKRRRQPRSRHSVRGAASSADAAPAAQDDDLVAEPRRASYESGLARSTHMQPMNASSPIAGTHREPLQKASMAALVRETRERAEALRGTPSRTAMRRERRSSDRAKTPEHFDSDLWHELPADVRQDVVGGEPAAAASPAGQAARSAASASGLEAVDTVRSEPLLPLSVQRRAPPRVRPGVGKRLGSLQQNRQDRREPVSSAPLTAAREFHDSIQRLTALKRQQAKQASAEVQEYTKRGGGSTAQSSSSRRLSYDAERLQRADQRHRSDMAQARAELTEKSVRHYLALLRPRFAVHFHAWHEN